MIMYLMFAFDLHGHSQSPDFDHTEPSHCQTRQKESQELQQTGVPTTKLSNTLLSAAL